MLISVSYHGTHNARIELKGPNSLHMQYWTRRGFYTIDANGTIREKPLSAWFRTLIVERAKISGLLKEVVNLAYTPLKSPRVLNGPMYIAADLVQVVIRLQHLVDRRQGLKREDAHPFRLAAGLEGEEPDVSADVDDGGSGSDHDAELEVASMFKQIRKQQRRSLLLRQ